MADAPAPKIHEKLSLSPPIFGGEGGHFFYKCDYSGLPCESAFAFPESVLKGRVTKEPSSRLRGRFYDANCAIAWLKQNKENIPPAIYEAAVEWVCVRVSAVHGADSRAHFVLAPPASWLDINGGNKTPEQWLALYKSPSRVIAEITAAEEKAVRDVQKADRAEKKKRSKDESASTDEVKEPKAPKKKKNKAKEEDDASSVSSSSSTGNKPKVPKVKKVPSDAALPTVVAPPATLKVKAPKKKSAAAAAASPAAAAAPSVETKLGSGKKKCRVQAGKHAFEGESTSYYTLMGKAFMASAESFRAPEFVGLLVMDKNKVTLRPLCGAPKLTVEDVVMAQVPAIEWSALPPQCK